MLGAIATIAAPIATSVENKRLARRVPILSMSKPPMKTETIAATLYTVYICPIASRPTPSAVMSVGAIAPTLSYAK